MPRKLVPRRYVSGTFSPAPDGDATAGFHRWNEAWRQLLDDPQSRARLDRPGELLSEYFRERHRSRLGKIVTAANRWPDWCETVVLIAPHRDAMSARALFAAAAHPFYNELSAGGRGGRPRLFILEPTFDHDRIRAVLDLLKPTADADAPHNRWSLVVAGSEVAEVAATAGPFIAALGGDAARHFVLGDDPAATSLAAWDAPPYFEPSTLLASSIVGADVVQQLKGAIWFAEQAKVATADDNEAVRFAEFLFREPAQIVTWHGAPAGIVQPFLEPLGLRALDGCNPATHGELLAPSSSLPRLHLWSDAIRHDRLSETEPIHADGEPYPDTAIERFVAAPQSLVAVYDQVRAAERAQGIRSAEIRLARLGDPALGELSAWLSAVTLLHQSECRT